MRENVDSIIYKINLIHFSFGSDGHTLSKSGKNMLKLNELQL